MSSGLESLKARMAQVNALGAATALMEWDQQCLMPEGGAGARSEHVGLLSEMAHSLFVAEETQRALESAESEVSGGDDDDSAMVRVVRRQMDIKTKIPGDLVAEQAKLAAVGHEVWVKARKNNDYKSFQPILEQTVDISRKIAECLGYEDHPYDAVTDQFEQGATRKFWDAMFDSIRQPLTDLVSEIKNSPSQPDDSFLYGDWDESAQRSFSLKLIEGIGFRMDRGRLDTAPHPFCTNFAIGDVRLTTRFLDYLPSAVFGSLHEAGHGHYEQGSPDEWDRTPLAGGVSLGWHESQSRTWENIVGRSLPFWKHYYADLQAAFPQLGSVDLETFYRAVNRSRPTLIRVEADEVTYNLHIMVRYELEKGMMDGSIKVADIPTEWNDRYKTYLGIVPDSDAKGCLQDVHWSGGMLGYFPTYSMGNILSYQLWELLESDLGDTDALMEKGDFAPILGWLREKVYRMGSKYPPQELLQRVTGGGLDAEPYLRRIRAKYAGIYGLE
ncbi:MAG: carboxypeptidase M32 [Armatimonadetes bacterium]|nr:carboxypeptidase M32 [Armatimonadota bacterium]MBX3108672.1 carboxypeptidase M32 [Fimbriimonadaceae bacterium]